MSRKQLLFTQPLATGPEQLVAMNTPTPISLAASFNTAPSTVNFQDNVAYQMNITTSDSEGTFKLQGSLDGDNWADLGTAGVVAAANDVSVINANQIPFTQVRLAYTATTPGTGTVIILFSARTVGA